MEGSLTDETDEGSDGWESSTDSGDSCATSRVSTSEEEREGNIWEVESESSHEKEIAEEPMEEEDTESVGSAAMDTTLGSVAPSSQEARQLEDSWISATQLGGNSGTESASTKCGLDTPMVGGDAASVAHEEQRKGQLEPPIPLPSPMNSPKWEDKPSAEVTESDQGNEVICYAMEAEVPRLNLWGEGG